MRKVHDSAVKGFTDSQLYESGRPSYPDDSISKILDIIGESTSSKESNYRIVELGAGTGKFTRSFLLHSLKVGNTKKFKYIATEPSEGFRKSIETSTGQYQFKEQGVLSVLDGTGNCIPSEDSSLDCIIAAQAFHWMATESTLMEAHRALKPGAPLVLIWNTYDYKANLWMRMIDDEILAPAYKVTKAPRQQDLTWANCFQTPQSIGLFSSPIQYWYGRQAHSGPIQNVVSRIMSTSVIAEKPDDEKEAIRKHLDSILSSHPDLAEARSSGVFTIDYVTEIAWTTSLKKLT